MYISILQHNSGTSEAISTNLDTHITYDPETNIVGDKKTSDPNMNKMCILNSIQWLFRFGWALG
jgi:hypothetical protein